ncbi:MAG: LacI family DNA-binding transcriptional regulator, partial [Lachnospiraceae bacterium]|nr:LacI family DNA-binding transcriptional regulator [Lachnospiraceae bacterium]
MAKKVKMADIAAELKVSTVTVSKALSGQKGVSEEMRERIKNLADEWGYRQPSTMKQ